MARLAAGDPAPAFTLPNDSGKDVSLADFTGTRVIVYFYPAAMTPGCTTEARDFSAQHKDLNKDNIEVIGISPDPVDKLAKFRKVERLTITLLSDADKTVMRAFGAYGPKKLYGRDVEGVIRSTFVIDVDNEGRGTITQAQYSVKAKGHVERLLRGL